MQWQASAHKTTAQLRFDLQFRFVRRLNLFQFHWRNHAALLTEHSLFSCVHVRDTTRSLLAFISLINTASTLPCMVT